MADAGEREAAGGGVVSSEVVDEASRAGAEHDPGDRVDHEQGGEQVQVRVAEPRPADGLVLLVGQLPGRLEDPDGFEVELVARPED